MSPMPSTSCINCGLTYQSHVERTDGACGSFDSGASPARDAPAGIGTVKRCARPDCYVHDGEGCSRGHMDRERCPRWRETAGETPRGDQ